jgi:hypothetical protein
MAITYNFAIDSNLLRVKTFGKDDNLEQVIEYGSAIIQYSLSSGCTRILCDETELEYTLGTFDTFESAKFISENAPKIAKVAIVCKSEQIQDAEFWETVAVNRGLSVKVFKTVLDAEEWINQ